MSHLNQRVLSFFRKKYNIELDQSDTLLMLSGGLDSTGALWQLLQNKEHRIHIHHLYLLNKQNRAEAEQQAVKNILSHISKSYNFKYSESYHEYPFYSHIDSINTETEEVKLVQNFIADSDMYNFIAGTICLSLPTITKIAIGRTKSDSGSDMEKRVIRGNKLLELFAPNVKKIYPVIHLTKTEIHNMLPEEIRNMTWSCRNPIIIDKDTFKQCGKCKTCQEIHSIKNGIQ